jgi:conjugative relaxase-like TrwC/TraI family protein
VALPGCRVAEEVGPVLSSAKIGTSSWRYYTDGVACRASEYYAGAGEAPGRWHGRGLEQLGLEAGAVVSERELEALFARGLHPAAGSRLGRAWRADGVTGFDLTFSAPKSVSALWALGDSPVAGEAVAAHRAAVRVGLAYLDRHAALSRRGTDGVEQIGSAGLVAAVFDHRSSRAGDPQLHTHALVLNKVRCADGRWRTLDATELFHHKKSAGMIYQAALRNEMHQRLGVTFREVNENGQADLAGMPDQLLKLWSKRAASIDAEAAPKIAEYEKLLGRTLSSSERVGVVKTAVLKTRAAKQHPELSALHATWTAEAARVGWTPHRLRTAVRLRVPRTRPGPDAGVLPRGAGVLPTDSGDLPSDRADLSRPTEPVPPAVDRGGPQHAEPVLPAPPAVLPAPPAVLPAEPTVAAEAAARLGAEVAAGALQAAGARRAVFSRADVAGQVAAQLPTTGLSAAEVVAHIEQLTDAALGLDAAIPIGQQTIGVTARASDARYATVQVLNAEARILNLAARGRRGGYGQVPHTALMPVGRDGELDPSQYRAVLQLAGGGDFVSVLTAPAGAGKTSTLGAASRAWQDAGYRVVGLAPSARAAAELGAATGGPADTLAKWLHTHRSAPPTAQEVAALDGRTVVIVDEASMAGTLDLDPLITAAGRAGAKVVLVGDPAQIGVVNGAGGMLAALARAGHGVELNQIHRFSHAWERPASLALRDGTPGALAAYRLAGRLHPCADGDTALDGVFAHWAAARADGQDALMLARTRLDVDALNLRARAAALAAGEVAGPVTVAGERQWQAGDLLRARRNDRRLIVGDGHVRNGDRYRVLGPGPDGALLVEDLSGRGRAILPAAYLAEHADYGWASTIDGAQGATADVGIVLARPGLDREHLYVAMTRGRHANHAYITPDPSTDDDDHHGQHGQPHSRRPAHAEVDPQEQAARVLQAALTRSGAQDAAHTALEQARAQAAQTVRQQERQAERAAARERAAATRQRRQDQPLTAEHARAAQQLEQYRADRDQLRADREALHRSLQHAQTELAALPRWARSRRRALTDTISSSQRRLQQTAPTQASLDAEVDRLTRQVTHHTRQRARDLAVRDPLPSGTTELARAAELAWPRPAVPGVRDPFSSALARPRDPYRGPERDHGSALSR